MSEKTDFNLLRKHMVQHGDRLERIENVVGVGTPDVNYCINGVEGWIELKSPKEPLRATSKLFADNHKLNVDQRNWFLRQRNAGGRGYILICTNRQWMLVDGEYADYINKMTATKLESISCWYTEKPIAKPFWRSLRKVLSV